MASTKKLVDTKKMAESKSPMAAPVTVTRNGRRYYSRETKRSIIAQCTVPGASVSGVALANGFNANLVRKWILKHRRSEQGRKAGPRMLPVRVEKTNGKVTTRRRAATAESNAGVIELEVGATRVILRGEVNRDRLLTVLELLARYR